MGSLMGLILWIIFLFGLMAVFKHFLPLIKGKLGENYVNQRLQQNFAAPYVIIDNITLPDGQGSTTQIDHILLSPFAIFVIETKNYQGWIFASERQKQWTQTIYQRKHRFQNPLHQNYKHIKVLQNIFADLIEADHFQGFVVFTGTAEFKTKIPKHVFVDEDWIEFIQSFQSTRISDETMQKLEQRLATMSLEKSWQTNREHVKNLKQRTKPPAV